MTRTRLPPGFRFHPTDVELVMYYLKRKVLGRKLHFESIAELNIYKFSPWDLPDKSSMKTKDREWYFFVPIEMKYASGVRMNRATEIGYWKTTGRDRPVQYNENVVGKVRTLVFHLGCAPHGERTDWVIHEYKMEDKSLAANEVALGAYVLCKVFHKNGPGPKNGAQYGALFEEKDWNDDFTIPPPFLPVVELEKNLNQNTSVALSIVDPSRSPELPVTEPGPSMIQGSKENALLNGERLSIVTSTINPVHTSSSREMGISSSAAQDMGFDSEHEDIAHLLASFDTDPMPLTWNGNPNNIEAHLDSGRETQLVPNSSLNPYSDLEDLNGLENLNSSGLDFSDAAFLELDDLNAPLNCGARVGEMLSNGFHSPCTFTGSEYVSPETTQGTFSVYDPHPTYLNCGARVGEMLSNGFHSPCNFTGSEYVSPETTQGTFSVYDPHLTYLHQLSFGFNSSEIQENSSLVPMGQNWQPAYPR